MSVTLYDFGPSPFCLKIRALLEYKGVEYARRDVRQPATWVSLRRRSPTHQVPALDIDGDLVIDSTAIAYRLETRWPEPPVIPASPEAAARCHVLEDWADESLYFLGLYYRWVDPAGRAAAGAAFRGPIGPLVGTLIGRGARKRAAAQGVGRKPASLVAEELERQLTHLEALLDDRAFLLGDAPRLCDFAVAAQLLYLRRTPTARAPVDRRPALGPYLDRFRALRAGAKA